MYVHACAVYSAMDDVDTNGAIIESNHQGVTVNGIPHLAYLGQMLEKEGEFGIGIFPEGLVHSRDCQNESRTAGA